MTSCLYVECSPQLLHDSQQHTQHYEMILYSIQHQGLKDLLVNRLSHF